jgi:hypothetical protein
VFYKRAYKRKLLLVALTKRQSSAPEAQAPSGVSLEQRKKLAREAIEKMHKIVEEYLARVKQEQAGLQDQRALDAHAEIERIKASIGVAPSAN